MKTPGFAVTRFGKDQAMSPTPFARWIDIADLHTEDIAVEPDRRIEIGRRQRNVMNTTPRKCDVCGGRCVHRHLWCLSFFEDTSSVAWTRVRQIVKMRHAPGDRTRNE